MIYELSRGLRDLALFTAPADQRLALEKELEHEGVDFLIRAIGEGKINVFFGKTECVEVVREFQVDALSELTPEQDFILGIMLGYQRSSQCERYLRRKSQLDANARVTTRVSAPRSSANRESTRPSISQAS